ncbi:MAG: hypothetical protein FWC43_09490 [Planctomycetaceae bacterium]|nr:hypothetical protein [Planctomycetaceae bacterium]
MMTVAVLERPKTRKRSATSLQREIRNRVDCIHDKDILRAILRYVLKVEPENPELERKLEAAKRDIDEGRVISNEEFMKWVEQWLSEH